MVLDRETQVEKLQYARYLIRGGKSRRAITPILVARYGEGIGKTTFANLFAARITHVVQREAARPVGFKAPRRRKQRLYNDLVRAYFLPGEARELASNLKGMKKVHEIRVMIAERSRLRKRFVRHAVQEGYTSKEFSRQWHKAVESWYKTAAIKWQIRWEKWHRGRGDRVLKKRDLKSLLWKWFGHTKSELPPDLQYETPKKERRKQQDFVVKDKVQVSRWINELNTKIADPATSPEQRKQFRQQVKNLRESLR